MITHNLTNTVVVRDLWNRVELGKHHHNISIPIPAHGAGLYRVSPCPARQTADQSHRDLAVASDKL